MRPLIAVTGRRAAQVAILRFSATLAAEAICESVWAAGGEPVILHPPAADPLAEIPHRLEAFDGVLLPGGADLEPGRYGAQPAQETTDTVAFQDDFDLGVTTALLDTDIPVLAICRGLQVLNVALGGTLHQHLPDLITSDEHRPSPAVFGRTEVKVEPDSLTARLLGDRSSVHCYHHQALDVVADRLRVTARAGDGTVEAAEVEDTAFALGVQWHPEENPDDLRLFTALVAEASRRRTP